MLQNGAPYFINIDDSYNYFSKIVGMKERLAKRDFSCFEIVFSLFSQFTQKNPHLLERHEENFNMSITKKDVLT